MSDGATVQRVDETFSSEENDDVVVDDSQEALSGRLIFNNSYELNQVSASLHHYYDNFEDQNYLLVGMYAAILIVALFANVLVIVVVFNNKNMRSVTNYFVVNLSISDLLVTILCMPMGISQAISITWIYGDMMCKLFYYLQGVAVGASVFTITAMSIDRYLAIRNPIQFRIVFNRKITSIVIAVIWFASLVIFGPLLLAVKLQSFEFKNITLSLRRDGVDQIVEVFNPPSLYFCSEEFDSLGFSASVFGMSCFVVVYAIPGVIVIVAYSGMGRTLCSRKPPFDCDNTQGSASLQQGFRLVRERKRVAWILLIMAILFALCWLPYNLLRLFMDFDIIGSRGKVLADLQSYFLFLGHANSAINPVVYCVMTRNFRRKVREILCRNHYRISQRKSQRKTPAADAGGCAVYSGAGQRRMLYNQGYHRGNELIGENVHQTSPQSKLTTSTGCDGSYSRHSPHRHCYMLKPTIQMQTYPHRSIKGVTEK